jgi:endoplasmic reticulum Man9GlcNAc2 1,2-alpha-mannosidase
MGWVIVDALDTMMLMNLTDEVARARTWITESLNWDQDKEVSLFETTIRMLGGLLSAHYLSGNDDVYLEKAVDLADRLLGGFESPSGIPYASVNLKQRSGSQSHADGGSSTTAEVSTLQLEFKYLAKLTGETLYWEKAEKVMEALESNKAQDGLVPIFVSPESGKPIRDEVHFRSLHN